MFSSRLTTTISDAMPPAAWNIADQKATSGFRNLSQVSGATMSFVAARACWAERKVEPAQPKAT